MRSSRSFIPGLALMKGEGRTQPPHFLFCVVISPRRSLPPPFINLNWHLRCPPATSLVSPRRRPVLARKPHKSNVVRECIFTTRVTATSMMVVHTIPNT
jgi:hypothetical protein